MHLAPVPHSDFLVHWTGKDIDNNYDDGDWTAPGYRMSDAVAEKYVERLLSILQHGFWMTEEPARTVRIEGHAPMEIPPVVRTCFTELKLSLSRGHASQYGRLGIAVKRPFVVRRGGRPLVYYAYYDNGPQDPFLLACLSDFKERELLGYLQPMNRPKAPGSTDRMMYDLYGESEWRIVDRDGLRTRGLVNEPPREMLSLPFQPHSLLPIDGWLALIIYPSIKVKALCQEAGSPVRRAIEAIKWNAADQANRVEPGNWPAEFNLDDCRNF